MRLSQVMALTFRGSRMGVGAEAFRGPGALARAGPLE